MKYLPFIAFAGFALTGCATSYQNEGVTGGYSDIQLEPDVFRITFRGNGFTSPTRAADFAMLHAADLALRRGFQYFAIIGESETGRTITVTEDEGQIETIFKPLSRLVVRCLRTKPNGVLSLNAETVSNSIRKKYHVNG